MSNVPTYMGLGAPGREIKNLSTADYTLTVDDASKLLIVAAGLNGVTYTLPNPSEDNIGLVYEFAFVGDAVNNENIIKTSSDFDVAVAGSTGVGVSAGSTAEGNEWIRLVCISPQRWLQLGGIAPWVATTT